MWSVKLLLATRHVAVGRARMNGLALQTTHQGGVGKRISTGVVRDVAALAVAGATALAAVVAAVAVGVVVVGVVVAGDDAGDDARVNLH